MTRNVATTTTEINPTDEGQNNSTNESSNRKNAKRVTNLIELFEKMKKRNEGENEKLLKVNLDTKSRLVHEEGGRRDIPSKLYEIFNPKKRHMTPPPRLKRIGNSKNSKNKMKVNPGKSKTIDKYFTSPAHLIQTNPAILDQSNGRIANLGDMCDSTPGPLR